MNIRFIVLTCDMYLNTRVVSQRQTFLKNQKRTFLTDSSEYNSDDVIGYDTPKNYDGIQDKYISFFKNYKFIDDYYFFIDDDTFVNVEKMRLLDLPSNKVRFCIFRQSYLDQNGMDIKGNYTGYPMYKISGQNTQLPLSYPSGGSGFIVSRETCLSIQTLLNSLSYDDIPKSGHSDVTVGFWLRSCDVDMIKVDYLWFNNPQKLLKECIGVDKYYFLSKNGWYFSTDEMENAVTYHYVSESMMYQLENNEIVYE